MWYSLASYAALAALSLLAIKYYHPQFFDKFCSTHTVPAEADPKPAKKQKSKKAKSGDDKASVGAASRSEGASKKRKIVSPPASSQNAKATSQGEEAASASDDEASMSNKEFAQQLAQVQAGVKLEKKQAAGKTSRRTVKPSLKSQKGFVEPSSLSPDTSSTGGRDADDDLSPNESSSPGTPLAAAAARPPQAGDVSDMLEPAAPPPRTLRLTDVKPAEEKKKKPARHNYEPVLTKKQKQRQKIQEENRRLKEEADRLHEAKKQQQLTTARLAEGTSKQIKANAFAAAQNAWHKKPVAPPAQEQTQQQQQQQVTHLPLLDTFEPEKQSGATQAKSAAAAATQVEPAGSDLPREPNWAQHVNEAAQDEWAKTLVEEESWEPVVSKKTKKKSRKDTDTSSDASGALSKHQTPSVTTGSRKSSFVAKQPPQAVFADNRFASMEKPNGDTWEA